MMIKTRMIIEVKFDVFVYRRFVSSDHLLRQIDFGN